ncbi:helix-turn-helix domain-containing protein [Saccharolobus shibatae]|uniref:helix-turn-helix domain-containing protein n=1 Tax=Saccharolobus shibatae TaxID=2286 RepID=UPI0021BBD0C0|nr:helix-turn-helix domain-containing protein [Saccharolobus shibatae]
MIFAIEHESCWTSFVGDFVVRTIKFSVDSEKNYIRSIITLDKAYKGIISKIRKSNSFLGNSSLMLDQNGRIIFDFRKKFRGTVMDTVYLHNGMIIDGFKYNGKEFWRILIYESHLNELLQDLRSKGNIYLIRKSEFEIEDDDLSPQELKILGVAYRTGYFDFPRKIKSDKISKLVDISKSTFIYHLRSAEHKMVKKYLKEIEFLNLPNKLKKDNDNP